MLEVIVGCIIGGFVGSVITMKLVSVLVRGNESGEITCRKLTVVDAYGMERVVLGPKYYGGYVSVNGDEKSGERLGINIAVGVSLPSAKMGNRKRRSLSMDLAVSMAKMENRRRGSVFIKMAVR